MSNSGRLDYLRRLMKNVTNLKELCDVNLVAGKDNQKFPVHRLIVRGASEYFDALLDPNSRDGSEQNITLNNIDGTTLKSIIDYIYQGEITIDHRNICAITAASSWMQLIELQKRCTAFAMHGLNTENCIGILLDAEEQHLDELKSKAFDTICAEYEQLSNDEIAKIDETTYRELLACDRLSGVESVIFNGLVYWLFINQADDDESIPEFLKLIRLRHIPGQIFMDVVEPFFAKHNQRNLISDEYRNRLLHPNEMCGQRRWSPKDIHLVSIGKRAIGSNLGYMSMYRTENFSFNKYDQETNAWVGVKTIAVDRSSVNVHSVVIASDKLYVICGAPNEMWAYDLNDYTRIELPGMTRNRSGFTAVVVENYIHTLGGYNPRSESYSAQVHRALNMADGSSMNALRHDLSSYERFDIEQQMWTTHNNAMMGSRMGSMTAIEFNGSIHVAFTEEDLTTRAVPIMIPQRPLRSVEVQPSNAHVQLVHDHNYAPPLEQYALAHGGQYQRMEAVLNTGNRDQRRLAPTKLYCVDPVNYTWQFKANVANRATFAKTSSSLYVIEDNRVLHRYDPVEKTVTKIGDFTLNGIIVHTIELGEDIYLLASQDFVKLKFKTTGDQEDIIVTKLRSPNVNTTNCMYLQ